jgi:ABC-2 type transport system permease protein
VSKAQRRNEAEAVLVPMVMVILMFMLMMMGVAPMLQTVMEEKNQHIAEVMLSAVTPFQFMMGKLLGSVCVSLTGCAVYISGGTFALTSMALTEYIPFGVLVWFFVYLILAIFMMGAMMAGLGSACNDAKDAQSLQLPVMLPMMIPMFMLMPVLKEPQSAFSTWLSLFPPFTPMLMILRQSAPGGIPAWQPWVGLIGLACFTLLAIWVGGRIFRVGILMQGKTPKLSEILRWAWRG